MSQRDPARRRIAILWIGTVVLVLASVGLAFREEALHQAAALQQAEAQTDVLAGSVGAALSFNDSSAMRQYLGALMRNPQVAAAGIYGENGQQLALLARPGADAPATLTGEKTLHAGGRVVVARPVIEQGQTLGYVYIETTPEGASAFVARHTGLVILTLLALLLLSFVTGSAARLTVANARLSEEIGARAAAEEALRQSQKLEALGQLTGGIAHDFNTLLQAIHGAFELILGRSADEKTVRRWARNGLEAAERGASLTRQLLAFSRQQKLEMKPLLVGETIEGMQDLLTRTLGPRVELILDLDNQPRVPVMSDVTQLELALMNLAVNARDAMPEGGRLTVRTRRVELSGDAVLQAGRYLQLQVIDTGEGMPLHVARRAFDPFFTTKAVGKGTGLGLAQVYGVARQAGGDARIASTPHGGTTVTMLFRAAETAAPDAEHETRASLETPGARSACVLLVDDDEAVRQVVRGGLEMRGFRVLEAGSGEAALALAAEHPEIAVIDYAMPGMDGAQTAEQLKRLLPQLPIILASGHSDTASIERALGGQATVLRKPFDIAKLSEIMTRMLRSGA